MRLTWFILLLCYSILGPRMSLQLWSRWSVPRSRQHQRLASPLCYFALRAATYGCCHVCAIRLPNSVAVDRDTQILNGFKVKEIVPPCRLKLETLPMRHLEYTWKRSPTKEYVYEILTWVTSLFCGCLRLKISKRDHLRWEAVAFVPWP